MNTVRYTYEGLKRTAALSSFLLIANLPCLLLSFNRSQPPAFRKPWHNSNPFTIMKINRKISRCTGCRGLLPKNADNSPCPPTFDLVVQHVEKDEYPYKDPLTSAVQNRISAGKPKYYHPMLSCILQRHP